MLLLKWENPNNWNSNIYDKKMLTKWVKSFICSKKDAKTIYMWYISNITVYEMSNYLKDSLWCYNAMNLDSWGSLWMVYNNNTIKKSGRKVMDAFVVIETKNENITAKKDKVIALFDSKNNSLIKNSEIRKTNEDSFNSYDYSLTFGGNCTIPYDVMSINGEVFYIDSSSEKWAEIANKAFSISDEKDLSKYLKWLSKTNSDIVKTSIDEKKYCKNDFSQDKYLDFLDSWWNSNDLDFQQENTTDLIMNSQNNISDDLIYDEIEKELEQEVLQQEKWENIMIKKYEKNWLNSKKCVAKRRNIWYNKAKYSFTFNYGK